MKVIANRYEVQELIGQGGMGSVFRAIDQQTGTTVAIKSLKPDVIASDPTLLERFAREGEMLRILNHPNIVKMLAAFEENGEHYIVMEYVGGGSLQDLLSRSERMSIARVLEIALDLADALTRAHRLKIIHRDLKPANVLLSEDGTPRLTDFGVAQMGDRTRVTQGGSIIGTYAYLSPEVCMGLEVDGRSDIWSFGVMIYEMLSGERPFTDSQPAALLTAIMTREPMYLGDLRPEAPQELIDLVHAMLEKDRDQRVPTIRIVGAELENIIQNTDALSGDTRQRIMGEDDPARFATPTPSSVKSGLTPPPIPRSGYTPLPRTGYTPLPRRGSTGSYKRPAAPDTPLPGSIETVNLSPNDVTAALEGGRRKRSPLLWLAPLALLVTLIVGAAFLLPQILGAAPAPIAPVEPVGEGEMMVLVAQMERLGTTEREVTRFVVENLRRFFEEDLPYTAVRIREYSGVITSSEQAQQIAEANSAVVILWGNYNADSIEINVEIGVTSGFEYIALPRATITQITNVRVSLSDPRRESLVPPVLAVMEILYAADGSAIDFASFLSYMQLFDGETPQISGNSAAARFHRASLEFLTDPEQARQELTNAINLVGTNPLLFAMRALANLRIGDLDAGFTDAQSAQRLGPENWTLPLFSLVTATALFERDFEAAERYADQLVEFRPDSWFSYMMRGLVYYESGQYDAAGEDLERSLELSPTLQFPYTFAASVAMRQGRVEDAIALTRRALVEFPDATRGNRVISAVFGTSIPQALLSVAFGNMALGQFETALANIQEAIDQGRPTSDMYLLQGLAYCNIEDYQAAEDAYSQAIELDPEFYLLYLMRAEVRTKSAPPNVIGAGADLLTVTNSPQGEAFADVIAAGMRGEPGLDCQAFFNR